MASSVAPVSISGGINLKAHDYCSEKLCSYGRATNLTIPRKLNQQRTNQKLSVRAASNDRSGGGDGDFIAGFLLGGALCGTLAYVFAPQIRKSLLNEDEYGFRRPRRPTYDGGVYYDEGVETRRQSLNAKINQLNSAISNVTSRLRGGNNEPAVPQETDPEGATMSKNFIVIRSSGEEYPWTCRMKSSLGRLVTSCLSDVLEEELSHLLQQLTHTQLMIDKQLISFSNSLNLLAMIKVIASFLTEHFTDQAALLASHPVLAHPLETPTPLSLPKVSNPNLLRGR